MAADNNSFVLYTNYFEILNDLTTEDAGFIFKAILEYKATGNFSIPNHLNIAFKFIKNQLDIDCIKYQEKCDKAKANGLKGGRPKNPKNQTVYKKPNAFSQNHNDNDNVNDNVNENDNVNVNVNDNVETEKKTDPFLNPIKNFFISEYEKVFLTKPFISRLDVDRLTELSNDNPDFKEVLPEALKRLKEINFSEIGFKPSANWLLKGNNFERIMNGEFEGNAKATDTLQTAIKELWGDRNNVDNG